MWQKLNYLIFGGKLIWATSPGSRGTEIPQIANLEKRFEKSFKKWGTDSILCRRLCKTWAVSEIDIIHLWDLRKGWVCNSGSGRGGNASGSTHSVEHFLRGDTPRPAKLGRRRKVRKRSIECFVLFPWVDLGVDFKNADTFAQKHPRTKKMPNLNFA